MAYYSKKSSTIQPVMQGHIRAIPPRKIAYVAQKISGCHILNKSSMHVSYVIPLHSSVAMALVILSIHVQFIISGDIRH